MFIRSYLHFDDQIVVDAGAVINLFDKESLRQRAAPIVNRV